MTKITLLPVGVSPAAWPLFVVDDLVVGRKLQTIIRRYPNTVPGILAIAVVDSSIPGHGRNLRCPQYPVGVECVRIEGIMPHPEKPTFSL